MSYKSKLLGATIVAASSAFASAAFADVCDTPSAMGDLGSFEGEVVTMMGSMQGKDEENLLAMASCFEAATGAVIKYSGSRDFAALIVADLRSNNAPNRTNRNTKLVDTPSAIPNTPSVVIHWWLANASNCTPRWDNKPGMYGPAKL